MRVHFILQGIAEIDSPIFPIEDAEKQGDIAYSRRVNQREHFRDMFEYESVKEDLIAILQVG